LNQNESKRIKTNQNESKRLEANLNARFAAESVAKLSDVARRFISKNERTLIVFWRMNVDEWFCEMSESVVCEQKDRKQHLLTFKPRIEEVLAVQ
jgi:hypothetical protein